MKENRILLTEATFTNLCKIGYFTTSDRHDIYFSKEDIINLSNGKIIENETTGSMYKFALQDIGFSLIKEILKRSPIFSELANNF